MNGILVINKNKDYTSRDVVNIVGKCLGTKKVGHTGTLDPLATGVLVLCIGKATKLVEILTSSYKEYEAEITLGIETDTLDITGNVLNEQDIKVSKDDILKVLESFKGKYNQEVPIYSAIKINGKKLYDYAREGIKVELPVHEVDIKAIELISDITYKDNKTIFKIKTTVSKGTYIRSLVRDISTKLNTIGVMSELNRTKQGNFTLDNSYTLEDIKNNNYKLMTIEDALKDFYTVTVDKELEKRVVNGAQLSNIYKRDVILFRNNKKILALYKDDNNTLKVWKMF